MDIWIIPSALDLKDGRADTVVVLSDAVVNGYWKDLRLMS